MLPLAQRAAVRDPCRVGAGRGRGFTGPWARLVGEDELGDGHKDEGMAAGMQQLHAAGPDNRRGRGEARDGPMGRMGGRGRCEALKREYEYAMRSGESMPR